MQPMVFYEVFKINPVVESIYLRSEETEESEPPCSTTLSITVAEAKEKQCSQF